jgi:hypothetical protein
VQIGCRWVLVDATWDSPLKKAGFPVNEHWDGISDTMCAVLPLRSPVRTAFCRTGTNAPCRNGGEAEFGPADGETDHWEAGGRDRFYRKRVGLRTQEELLLQEQFYDMFNTWLDDVRRSS